ncbi:alpha/beta fold hydrolase [Streptomyces bullii]|uniref:Alpha/beta fold hydrolase n=1 Tax=Streptomyces bullii TaxID=349910 RepID=A0ABW0UKI6_9ACTN
MNASHPTVLTTPDGTRIAYHDRRPTPEPTHSLLLLHGLAGHQGEWDVLASRLTAEGRRVVTYDARGHGESTRVPAATSRDAHVRDAVALIETLFLAPVTLVGQSLGGHTAMLLAAAHPRLVKSLVLVEAGPAGPSPDLPDRIAGWLDSWPTPFQSLEQAREFLGHEAWTRALEEGPDGWYPRCDRDVMIASVAELATTAYWTQWSRITCPTLLLQGENGTMRPGEPEQMLTLRPHARREVVPDAGHDVHLDQPDRLYEVIRTFLADDGTLTHQDETPTHQGAGR